MALSLNTRRRSCATTTPSAGASAPSLRSSGCTATPSRVLARPACPGTAPMQRASAIDPICPSSTTRSRSFRASRPRGSTTWCAHAVLPWRPDHFRHLIARHRPRPSAEALRLRTLPGEQAQVDWGTSGTLTIGRARRPLMAFVMVLSWSRQIYLRFFLDARMENFLRGHVAPSSAGARCRASPSTTI